MNARALPLAAATLLSLPCARAFAGTISLVVSSRAELREGRLRVAVTIANAGDEAAVNVRPTLSFLGRDVQAPAHETLAAKQSVESALAIDAPALGPGRWPFRLAVDYADAAYHPFQTLQLAAIALGEPGPVGLELAEIETTPIEDAGTARIRVRNSGAGKRETTISLSAPRDLEVEEPTRRVAFIPLDGEADVSFRLVPRTALAGSRYAVYALVEFDDPAGHQALIREAQVLVSGRRPRLAKGLAAASLALTLTWLVLLLLRRKRSS
jgi:hypothetical protein